jgi:hypothetical protein
MANSLLTINIITREAVRLWKNSNEFIQHIDQQYDDQFARTGAKIGTTCRIRLPNDFTGRRGPAASVQDTSEQSTSLTLSAQAGVDVSYSSVDRTMTLDDFSRRVLAPMVNTTAGIVAGDLMASVDGPSTVSGIPSGPGIAQLTANFDNAGNVQTPVAQTWLTAGALLDLRGAPRGRRKIILDPITMSRSVASLAGLLNPQNKIGEQYRSGQIASDTLGFDWYYDQTTVKHTTGAYTGAQATAFTVNGAGQSGLTITINAAGGTLALGDIVVFAGVNSVNRITKVSTGRLAQFVATQALANGGVTLNIFPALIPAAVGPPVSPVQYQTVDVSPANAGNIIPATLANAVYIKNFAFVPEACTMATADLELPRGVHEAAREAFDGISMRMISAYNITSDQFVTRLDVLYGFLWVRPDWACTVADVV